MSFAFHLPDVGEGLHEAEISRWLVQEGDVVREDQAIVEVATDKVTVELPSPVSGRVEQVMAKEGETVAVGSVIVLFEVSDQPVPKPVAPAGQVMAFTGGHHRANRAETDRPAAAAAPTPRQKALATPAVRRTAREMGIHLNDVRGTGPLGRVTQADLELHSHAGNGAVTPATSRVATALPPTATESIRPAATPPSAPVVSPAVINPAAVTPGQRVAVRGIRKAIAEAMVRSKHAAPHVTIHDEVDFSALIALRQQAKALGEQRGIKVTYLPFIFKAVVAALKDFPYLNARLDDVAQEIVLHSEYHIGMAVDTAAGLLVPVVKHADRKTTLQLAAEIHELSTKAHAGKLTLEEIRGGTFSISNMGTAGAGMYFTPVINHPEVAILGVGKIADRPVVRNGQLTVGPVGFLSLSFDHRVVDGGPAARFLARVTEFLTYPTLLMMEMM